MGSEPRRGSPSPSASPGAFDLAGEEVEQLQAGALQATRHGLEEAWVERRRQGVVGVQGGPQGDRLDTRARTGMTVTAVEVAR